MRFRLISQGRIVFDWGHVVAHKMSQELEDVSNYLLMNERIIASSFFFYACAQNMAISLYTIILKVMKSV